MKSVGIKYQILLITLIPVLLIDAYFTLTHIHNSIEQETDMLRTEGSIIARQIASASEFNLYTGYLDQIQYQLDQVVGSNDVVMISVYDRDGERVATSSIAGFDPEQGIDYLYFREAILSQSLDHSDVFAPDITDSRQTRLLGWVNLYVSDMQLQNRRVQIVIESILFFVVVLILAVALTFMISQRITRPIFAMVAHLRYVETGHLGKTIETTETNEIGALQSGFNRMTQALLANRRHLNQRIQQATQQLNEAITDLEAKNRELGFARDVAQDANRTKSEFLANMSHEIRTPINGIKGFIGLLGNSSLDPSQQRYVDIIMKSTNDLTSIVDEILDFSKMESGKLHIIDEAFDLHEVIEQTRDLLFINVLTKGIDLNLIIFSDTPRFVFGDKLRLKQILLNLIGNAIKFTEQGRVVIRVSLEDEAKDLANIRISIEDSGIGISREDQQQLFHAFSQVESSDTRRFTGTGLGLAISKNLATLMGGNIEMESTPGEGSRFCLRLPFKIGEFSDGEKTEDSDAARALIFSSEQVDLMELRTLFDRAGVITEAEQIDNSAGIDPLIHSVERNQAWIDLLVIDLRHLEIDLEPLLASEQVRNLRIIFMHYDPGVDIGFDMARTEFFSIINTSQKIAQLLESDSQPQAIAEESGEVASRERKKVLLVDDNQVNLKLASELIRLWGHDVREAEHGAQAFEIYQREHFDLIILDIQMPDIDGVSLLHMMREHNPADKTPMVALTANVLNREAERLLGLGFDYFLGKPIDEAKFRALLDGQPQRRDSNDIGETTHKDCSLDYARSLALSAGNESLLKQILEILLRDLPEQRQQLTDAYADDDFDRLGTLVHKLQGVTCYASLPRLRRIVLKLQKKLADDNKASLDELMQELDTELNTVALEVSERLQNFGTDGTPGEDSKNALASG